MAIIKIETLKEDEFQKMARYSGLVCDPYDIARVYILSDEEMNIGIPEQTFEDLFFEDTEVDKVYYSEHPFKKYKFEYRVPGFYKYNESLGFYKESKERLDKILNEISEN